MCAWASPAWAGVALRPVPMAHTGSYAMTSEPTWAGVRPGQRRVDLAVEHGQRPVRVALLERLADADDGREVGRRGRRELAVHPLVGVAEQAPPLRVADDDVAGAGVLDHRGADLAREGAVALEVAVLRRDADVRCLAPPRPPRASAVNGGATTISAPVTPAVNAQNSRR